MRLQLIIPKFERKFILDHRNIKEFMRSKIWFAPLSLPIIAALTPREIEVSILDENIESIDYNEKADLVGISAFTSLATRAYEIADNFRNRGTKVVLGGIHPSLLPDEAIHHADTVVIGEVENVWDELIDDFKKGMLKNFYKSSFRTNLENQIIPRWDLLKLDSYRTCMIQTTRGCPFNCSFCSVKAFFGEEYRFKPIENIVREIKVLQSLRYKGNFFFADDNFAANPKYTRELLLALIDLKIKNWSVQISINTDEQILKLMADAGCTQVAVGLESLSQKTIDLMGKGAVNKIKLYRKAIEKIHYYGIGIVASFIVGYDSDDISIFDNIARLVDSTNIEFPLVNILTPFPGTDIAKQLEKENRITDTDWRNFDGYSVCFRPKFISAEELHRRVFEIIKRFYTYKNLYHRLSKSWKRGVLVNKINLIEYFFNKNRLKFSLFALRLKDIKKAWFILKSLWHIPNPRFYSIFFGLTIHDLIYNKRPLTSIHKCI